MLCHRATFSWRLLRCAAKSLPVLHRRRNSASRAQSFQDPFVFVSCVYGYDPFNMEMPEDVVQQTCNIWDSISATFAAGPKAGSEEIVKTRIFITDPAHGEPVLSTCARMMEGHRPASTLFVVPSLMRPEMKVGIEATAMWQLARRGI